MSRSFKKSPINKDRNSKSGKRFASRAVRRASDVPNGKQFRKVYCSWDISDWRFRGRSYTVEEFRRAWFNPDNRELDGLKNSFNNWKDAYRFWLRGYKRK